MRFTHKDGELRIADASAATGPIYIEVLFTNADLSFPVERPLADEELNMDRGILNSDATYSLGSDDKTMEPLPFSMTARIEGRLCRWLLIEGRRATWRTTMLLYRSI